MKCIVAVVLASTGKNASSCMFDSWEGYASTMGIEARPNGEARPDGSNAVVVVVVVL